MPISQPPVSPLTAPRTLFFLHFLGGTAQGWEPLIRLLRPAFHCVALDLPGFGGHARASGFTVADMAKYVAGAVRAAAPAQWGLVGHSMGAKVAAAVARQAEDGADGLAGLFGLALLAGSPPSPEPMDEQRRQTMLGWLAGDAESRRREAERFIAANTGRTLPPDTHGRAVEGVLAADRAAWVAWLEAGSREDWAARIGVLETPALLLAGADDADLGPEAQARLMAPHFAHATQATIPEAKHLLPMEAPEAVARLIHEHFGTAVPRSSSDGAYQALIRSDRVSTQTRAALEARWVPDPADYRPVAVSVPQLATLRAVLDRVVPQRSAGRIDLAARLDAQLATGPGDGWRHASLPPDTAAYQAGLDGLDAMAQEQFHQSFEQLAVDRQDAMLTAIAREAGPMQLWFEDLRADAVRIYVGHPATLASMGYSGIATGGDGEPKSGFSEVGIGRREAWEPLPRTAP